jgi:hypothetical protein
LQQLVLSQSFEPDLDLVAIRVGDVRVREAGGELAATEQAPACAFNLGNRLVALALGAFRPFSQVFDLTSGPIVQGWVA